MLFNDIIKIKRLSIKLFYKEKKTNDYLTKQGPVTMEDETKKLVRIPSLS